MAEHEFERFLEVLSKLLKLSSKETAAVADEICDHLEERYSELVGQGVSRDDAVKQALDEFDDAGEFAGRLNQLVRQRTRRRMMTGALTTAAASALAIVVTTAFWPVQQPGNPVRSVSANTNNEDGKVVSTSSADEVIYIDELQFLPEGLRQRCPADFQDVTLTQFVEAMRQITGMPVVLDRTEVEAVLVDSTFSVQCAGASALVALRRAIRQPELGGLDWFLEEGIIHISSHDGAKRYGRSMIDISSLLDAGFTMRGVIDSIMSLTSGPWQEVDGEGGQFFPIGSKLWIQAKLSTQLEVRSVLASLVTQGRRISVTESIVNQPVHIALQRRTSCDFRGTPLQDAIQTLAGRFRIQFEFDLRSLGTANVDLLAPVTLQLNDSTLSTILAVLLEDVQGVRLAAIPKDGLLVITVGEEADSWQEVQLFDVSDFVPPEEMAPMMELLIALTTGPWQEIDGEGGTIVELPRRRFLIRQNRRGLDEINELIGIHREGAKGHRAVPEANPDTIEVRYYRMTEVQANDLKEVIPRFVAVDAWSQFPDGTLPQIDRVSWTGAAAQNPGSLGGLGSGGMGGGRVGGGGFFQISGRGAEDTSEKPKAGEAGVPDGELRELLQEMLQELRGRQQPAAPAIAVLVIRQTVRVHREIEKFLRDLSTKSGASFFDPVPAPGGLGGGRGSGGFGGGGGGGGFF